jgi:hypothetical protein
MMLQVSREKKPSSHNVALTIPVSDQSKVPPTWFL